MTSSLDWASSVNQWSPEEVNFLTDYILSSSCFSDSMEWQKFFIQEALEVERFWIASRSHAASYKKWTHPSCVNIILVLAGWFLENTCLPSAYLFFLIWSSFSSCAHQHLPYAVESPGEFCCNLMRNVFDLCCGTEFYVLLSLPGQPLAAEFLLTSTWSVSVIFSNTKGTDLIM